MEEVSSFVQAQPPHPHTVECRGGPETPNQDSFSMELQAGCHAWWCSSPQGRTT